MSPLAPIEESRPNGGDGSDNPRCEWHERLIHSVSTRVATIEQYAHETRGALSGISSNLSDVKAWGEEFEKNWIVEFSRLSLAVEQVTSNSAEVGKRLAKLLDYFSLNDDIMPVVPPRPPLPTWNPDEAPSNIDPTIWERRAREANERANLEAERAAKVEELKDSLAVKVAALEARSSERSRQSERAQAQAAFEHENARAIAAAELERMRNNTKILLGVFGLIGILIGALVKWLV